MGLLGNVSLLQHVFKNLLAAIRIVIRVSDRIVVAWTLGDGRDDCAFRQSQLGNVLVEIPLGCCLYAERILTQVDGI